jgi:hypothetical protein
LASRGRLERDVDNDSLKTAQTKRHNEPDAVRLEFLALRKCLAKPSQGVRRTTRHNSPAFRDDRLEKSCAPCSAALSATTAASVTELPTPGFPANLATEPTRGRHQPNQVVLYFCGDPRVLLTHSLRMPRRCAMRLAPRNGRGGTLYRRLFDAGGLFDVRHQSVGELN